MDLFSPAHLILILVVVFFLFGAGKLPETGAALGKGIREFKKALNNLDKPEPINISVNEDSQEKASKESRCEATFKS